MLIEQLKKEGFRRGLSPRTIKTYAYCVNRFLYRFTHKELKEITKNEIKDHLDRFLDCGNTLNVHLNSLKFFFEEVLRKKLTINLRFSKKPKRLPEFLTKEEAVKLFSVIENPKHRLMVELMYGAGLRVSELTHLKIQDLELNQNYGWVRQGKGRKDRIFVIPMKLNEGIKGWIVNQSLRKEDWLFPGQKGHISEASLQMIVRSAKRKASLSKKVHPHTLRHSFATHLIQNGYAVTEVQPLMGHNQLETTMIYLHMASPTLL